MEFFCGDAAAAAADFAAARTAARCHLRGPAPQGAGAGGDTRRGLRWRPSASSTSPAIPATLARDVKLLAQEGYRAIRAAAVDMFPGTANVETICLLSKLNAKQHIEINLDMDELDLTDAEKKATYQEIKDYVLEHSGLKVSSLYIAQVKQKCGIIERENYNKPKSEDAKQPQCPPDKEKAIKEALTHFGMI